MKGDGVLESLKTLMRKEEKELVFAQCVIDDLLGILIDAFDCRRAVVFAANDL